MPTPQPHRPYHKASSNSPKANTNTNASTMNGSNGAQGEEQSRSTKKRANRQAKMKRRADRKKAEQEEFERMLAAALLASGAGAGSLGQAGVVRGMSEKKGEGPRHGGQEAQKVISGSTETLRRLEDGVYAPPEDQKSGPTGSEIRKGKQKIGAAGPPDRRDNSETGTQRAPARFAATPRISSSASTSMRAARVPPPPSLANSSLAPQRFHSPSLRDIDLYANSPQSQRWSSSLHTESKSWSLPHSTASHRRAPSPPPCSPALPTATQYFDESFARLEHALWTLIHRSNHFSTSSTNQLPRILCLLNHGIAWPDQTTEVLVQQSLRAGTNCPPPLYRAEVEVQVKELLRRIRATRLQFIGALEFGFRALGAGSSGGRVTRELLRAEIERVYEGEGFETGGLGLVLGGDVEDGDSNRSDGGGVDGDGGCGGGGGGRPFTGQLLGSGGTPSRQPSSAHLRSKDPTPTVRRCPAPLTSLHRPITTKSSASASPYRAPRPISAALTEPNWRLPRSLNAITHSTLANMPAIPPGGGEKEFCTYWIRHGECDFVQEGCRYKHAMPDLATLVRIGFRAVPEWWLEEVEGLAKEEEEEEEE